MPHHVSAALTPARPYGTGQNPFDYSWLPLSKMQTMFLHVVLIELASPDVAFLRNVEKLADRIATSSKDILDFRFVVNHANRSEGYNYAFFGRFIDEAAHERYQTMPEHEALKAYLAPRIKKLVVLDTHLA